MTAQPKSIVIYEIAKGKKLKVPVEKDSVWLSLNQIAELFDTDKSGISRHIDNIYTENELQKKATVAKIATVQLEGRRSINRKIDVYNLDMIISVGYRVNSKRATQFRIWATKALRDYILKGYAINKNRLVDTGMEELERAVNLIKQTLDSRVLTTKDHPLIDGNKRSGSLLFIHYLAQNGLLFRESGERTINDNTIVALALLISQSHPSDKEIMIHLITNLLR